MSTIAFSVGTRWGLVLAAAVVVLAVLALTPSLTWVPEVPLLAAGVVVPLLVVGVAGSRAGSRTGKASAGAQAGAVVGAIGGLAGGFAYVAFGKPALNVAAGLLAGAAAGALVGLAAGLAARRRGRS